MATLLLIVATVEPGQISNSLKSSEQEHVIEQVTSLDCTFSLNDELSVAVAPPRWSPQVAESILLVQCLCVALGAIGMVVTASLKLHGRLGQDWSSSDHAQRLTNPEAWIAPRWYDGDPHTSLPQTAGDRIRRSLLLLPILASLG